MNSSSVSRVAFCFAIAIESKRSSVGRCGLCSESRDNANTRITRLLRLTSIAGGEEGGVEEEMNGGGEEDVQEEKEEERRSI